MPKKEPLEGEGSYTGTRKYDAGVRKFVKSGEVEPAAKEARRAVDEEEKDPSKQRNR